MTMNDFLKKYYRQMHFNAMSPDVRARFDEIIKKDTLNDTMRLWRKDYMHLENGKYVQNEIPDTTKEEDLPDNVARDLFVACQKAFVDMNGALATFRDKEPYSAYFVNEYFGPDKLFNISPATAECEEGIKEMVALLRAPENEFVRQWLLTQKDDEDKAIFDKSNPSALDEFLQKCEKKEYNTKGNVQTKVKKIASVLNFAMGSDIENTKLAPIKSLTHLDDVVAPEAFGMDPKDIPDEKIAEFRKNILAKDKKTGEEKQTGILQTLYRSKTIRDRFAKFDGGTITGVITDKAENEIDYQKKDSANFVAPKPEDNLTPLQQVQKFVSDTYKDTLQKYEELRGAPVFFTSEAEDIFKAIDKVNDKETDEKNKIKPSQGLPKLVDRAEDVKKKLSSSPQAREYFDWFIETMNVVKDEIPKAYEGAWKDGKQMRCVIDKIILRATDPSNDDPHAIYKAMAAMEIMNAMKFGMVTGKLVEAMKNTEFSLFSDGKLSWNKNDGIQFVTKALDKSIKAAFVGLGYGLTFAKNKIKLAKYRTKYKGNGQLEDAFKKQEDMLKSQNAIQKKDLTNERNQVRAEKNGLKDTLLRLKNNDGINGRTIRAREKDVTALKSSMDALQNKENSFQQSRSILEKKAELEREIQELKDGIHQIKDVDHSVDKAYNRYKDENSYADMPTKVREAKEEELYNEWQKSKNDLEAKEKELATKESTLAANARMYKAAETNMNTLKKDHLAYEGLETKHKELKDKTESFRKASAELKDVNKVLKEKNAALKNWDKDHINNVLFLQNFWNELQNGGNTTFALSTKRAQARFDEKKMAILNQLRLEKSLAA